MRLIRAEVLGFCMGVRRAVELAARAAVGSNAGGTVRKVCTLGPLIHNPRVLEELRRLGIETLDEHRLPENLKGISVVIRAHGVGPHTEALLLERGAAVVDATCPRVKASQLKAKALAQRGVSLFLAGEEEHAEIAGLCAYAATAPFCAVAGNAACAEEAAAQLYARSPQAKTALIGQTTISEDEYSGIGAAIKKYFPHLEVVQTICAATTERQDALRKLLGVADTIVIAGGKESANTRRLLAIAQASGKPCILMESAAAIPSAFFSFETIGLCAGASTPDFVIDEIEAVLKKGSGEWGMGNGDIGL